ncbi:glycerophosphodiester phosphodiesterase [Oscillibacter hominis]|uniref:Glycerophosphodiester phosphodiesterase n=1 Tax=Oscillibacter hominis TaxID=2763056 RepID=A0A7G9B5I4_9FIRM|nr:glycerophosphodiester phosphodiesterase family protein [Oscillibacter hominis]QNL44815.1 glycerophosphodiester phosphodiesterase [Oscillibacter hominis]
MKELFWVVAAAVAVLLLLEFLLQGRRGHPQWKLLRKFRYAHRGYHQKPEIPENSLAAFRRAVEHGFGAELDVHLTRDKCLAVIHDSSLKRTCGVEADVEDLTAEQLKGYRLEGTEERIPLLEEVLPLFEGKTPLIVELKSARDNWNELTRLTCETLDRFHVAYCVESFDPRCLLWLKENRPLVVRGQLAQDFMKSPSGLSGTRRIALSYLLYNFRTRPDFVSYRFEDRNSWAVRLCCRSRGVQEVNWTIRSPQDQRKAEREGHLIIFESYDASADGRGARS